MKKAFLILLLLSSGSIATAKPHHRPKHIPAHAKICRQCDGDGLVRSWKKMWLGRRKCRDCDGRGYFLPKPPREPSHKKFDKKGPAHTKGPAHAKKGKPARKPAHKPATPRKDRRK